MNDRFKFRVWDNLCKRYDELHVMGLAQDGRLRHRGDEGLVPDDSEYTIEQCTGLRDCNGKLIYEGDVIERTYDMFGREKYIFSVVWYQGKMALLSSPNAAPVLVWDGLSYEVIGNIHEVKHE